MLRYWVIILVSVSWSRDLDGDISVAKVGILSVVIFLALCYNLSSALDFYLISSLIFYCNRLFSARLILFSSTSSLISCCFLSSCFKCFFSCSYKKLTRLIRLDILPEFSYSAIWDSFLFISSSSFLNYSLIFHMCCL